jgi:hypothetical protein
MSRCPPESARATGDSVQVPGGVEQFLGDLGVPHEQLHLDVGHQLLEFFRARDAGTAGQRGGQQSEV